MKKILIVNRHGEKVEGLEALLKTLFPECEICNAPVVGEDSRSPVHLKILLDEKKVTKAALPRDKKNSE